MGLPELARSRAVVADPQEINSTGYPEITAEVARRLLAEGTALRMLTCGPSREDPFGGQVVAAPLDFSDPEGLSRSIQGANVLYNTYWVRFGRGQTTCDEAVDNSRILFEAAAQAGVEPVFRHPQDGR